MTSGGLLRAGDIRPSRMARLAKNRATCRGRAIAQSSLNRVVGFTTRLSLFVRHEKPTLADTA